MGRINPLGCSGGGFGVGRATSECYLACGFAVTGPEILVVRVPIFRGPSNCSGITCPLGFFRQDRRLRTGGRVTGTAGLRGSAGGIGGAARVADALVSQKFFAAEPETGLDAITADVGTVGGWC